jgi:molybdopterin adenylyltransferase
MNNIKAICISEKKGTAKYPCESAQLIADWGLKNDAHAGKWHRQVSILRAEDLENFIKKAGPVAAGAFGENLIVEGIENDKIKIGQRFRCNDAVVEITQIGKTCHNDCEIKKRVGVCIMPHKGIFLRVINGGIIKVGDEFCAI